MYRIAYKKAAWKALQKLPAKHRGRFQQAFELLAQTPDRRDLDVDALTGRSGYRLRIGRWQAIYDIQNDKLVILVLDIGARGDVYK